MSAMDPNEQNALKPGPIAWMAAHPVAANLLMFVLVLGGFFSYTKSIKEVFPEFTLDTITVTMLYPGASPEEVEQGIVLSVEDAIRDVEGLGEIVSAASEGYGRVTAEVLDEDDMIRVAQDVKTAVDQITTFPVDAEDLTVTVDQRKRNVIELALYGSASEQALRENAERILDAIEQDKEIGSVELSGVRDYEIHIEVPQENLRRYNLNIPDIANKIARTAIEIGGGSIDTSSGEVLVRMTERRDYAFEFEDIPIITKANGSKVLLGDIATIREEFKDSNIYATYNGKPAVLINVFRVGDQTPIGVSDATMKHVEKFNANLPGDLKIAVLDDDSIVFKQRAELLIKNGLFGLVLVVIFLALFLDVRLALWVSMGIPISFMGAFVLFPATDFTVNMISMFAFIISLGIVVDDAIVVGENIHHKRQIGLNPLHASIEGTREVAIPVFVSVLTNMIAFLPLFFVPGFMGKIFSIIPTVVICVFFLSLIESLFILPHHLRFKSSSGMRPGPLLNLITLQKKFSAGFEYFVKAFYTPFLNSVIYYRYIALALFIAILMVMGSYVASGRVGMQLFPRVESDYAFAEATLKIGSSDDTVKAVETKILDAALSVIKENGNDTLSQGVFTEVHENKIEMRILLTEPNVRPLSTSAVTDLWRKKTGEIPGLESLKFLSNRGGPGSGAALTIELSHRDTQVLDAAAVSLAEALAEFSNTQDIDDGSAQGKKQYDFTMTNLGYTLGMTPADVGRQVRAAFYGSEALKQQRGRNEVRVLVLLPEEDRSSSYDLLNLMIRAPSGADVLVKDVVKSVEGRAYTTINRRDSRRVITVEADVDPPSEAGNLSATLEKGALPDLQARYPGLTYAYEGRQADRLESMESLKWGMLSVIFVMYAILAVLFSSYTQPFMVLIAIPFSMVGAVLGHFIMGFPLSIVSMFGIIALAGVVINDSLILIDLANRKQKEGEEHMHAVLSAATQRFRPIILTTLTTFVGLMPMILETSRQARFLVPMAISLGFGVLFATFLTLLLIPSLYMIVEDLKNIAQRTISKLFRA